MKGEKGEFVEEKIFSHHIVKRYLSEAHMFCPCGLQIFSILHYTFETN